MGLDTSKDINANSSRGYLLEKFTRHKGGVNCITLDPERCLMVSGGEDKTLKLWTLNNTPTHCKATMEGHAGYITCVTLHNKYIISGSVDNTIRKWCIATHKCLNILEGHTGRINRLVCAGDFLFSTSVDNSARVWSIETSDRSTDKDALVKALLGHSKPVYPIIFIPAEDNPLNGKTMKDSDVVITGSSDRTARIWSLLTGTAIHILKGHYGTINAIVSDPDGLLLFTGGGDGLICCWNIQNGECIRKMKGHEGAILTMIGHNKMLYSGGVDQTARAWIMDFGECIKIYHGHTNTVTCLKHDNGYLYTGCADNSARMFKARSGDCKRIFKGHTKTVIQVEVLYDKLYTVSADGSLRVWDTTGTLNDDATT